MNKKWGKLAQSSAQNLLASEIGTGLQACLPAALQAAGINPALIQSYIPAVLANVAPALAGYISGRMYGAQCGIFVSETSPFKPVLDKSVSLVSPVPAAPATPPLGTPAPVANQTPGGDVPPVSATSDIS